MASLCDAWARRDLAGVHALESPLIRARLSLQDWLRDRRLTRPEDLGRLHFAGGEALERCACLSTAGALRCQLLTAVRQDDGRTDTLVAGWELHDGQWFQTVMGPGATHCPG